MNRIDIRSYRADDRDAVIAVTLNAWTPIFVKTRNEVPGFVYDAFYPEGWQARQTADVSELLDGESQNVWVAVDDRAVVGFIGLREHPEDQMGEIYILAVTPGHQKRGIGRQLMMFAEARFRAVGLDLVMVETVGDIGHAPARRTYEASGYEPWPVARYFKKL
ncbi:MAG: GNAT family N-acetyltransferase [Pseudomonadota bacterium]